MAADFFLRLLQFSDGLFPAGGYAHSFGLETLAQSGRVQNETEVAAFLRAYLENSAAPTDAVAVLCARKYALADDLGAVLRLDSLLDALKPATELRDASRQMGRQTLRILRALMPFASASSDASQPPHGVATPSPNVVIPSERPGDPVRGAESDPNDLSLPLTDVVIPSGADVPHQRHEGVPFAGVEGSALPLAESELHLRRFVGRGFSRDMIEPPPGSLAPEVPLRQGTASAVPIRPVERGASAPEEQIAAFIARYAAAVETAATPCHHPTVFGLAGAAFHWPARETSSAFLYASSAMIVGAALRLLPLGQLAGQRILADAGSLIAALSESILDKNESDMHSFAPELEIAAMQHEALDARLFRS